MNKESLKELILSLSQDVVFQFEGDIVCINPWNEHKFQVGYGNFSCEYDDINLLMTEKIFNGKSLDEICEKIELIY